MTSSPSLTTRVHLSSTLYCTHILQYGCVALKSCLSWPAEDSHGSGFNLHQLTLLFLLRALELYIFFKQSTLQLTSTASGNHAALLYEQESDILIMTSFVNLKILNSAAKCHSTLDKHLYTSTNHY